MAENGHHPGYATQARREERLEQMRLKPGEQSGFRF